MKRTAGFCLTALAGSFALSGCGVTPPRVAYEVASTDEIQNPGYLFRHRRSVLLVEFDNNESKFKATPAPSELKDLEAYSPLYNIVGRDDLISTSQLKVTYVDNTKFIDELQVTTKNNLADTINKIGEVAKAAAPLLVGAVAGTRSKAPGFEKTMIDPAVFPVDQWQQDEVNKDYCLRLKSVSTEATMSIEDFIKKTGGGSTRTFPVPGCASGIVEVASCTGAQNVTTPALFRARVTYAHQNRIIPTALPSTGSLKMHTVCGASVTEADKQDRTDVLDLVKDLIDKVKEVQTTWKQEQEKKAGKK